MLPLEDAEGLGVESEALLVLLRCERGLVADLLRELVRFMEHSSASYFASPLNSVGEVVMEVGIGRGAAAGVCAE